MPRRWCKPVLLASTWSLYSVSISCNWTCPTTPLGSVYCRCISAARSSVPHSSRTPCHVPFRLIPSPVVSKFIMGDIWTVLSLAVGHSSWNSHRLCSTNFAKTGVLKSRRSIDLHIANVEARKVCSALKHTRFFITITCRPRWSRGNMLASRSKVRGFKSGWGRWIFSGHKNSEYMSSWRDFKLRVPSLRFQARQIDLWATFSRHIHVLVMPEFGGAQ